MAASVISSLGLDHPEVGTSSLAVVEEGNADSSFVLSCLIWDCLVGRSARQCKASGASGSSGLLLPRPSESSSAVLLITSHHSVAHYRNQSLKLGLNLSSISQKGLFEELDLMKEMCDQVGGSEYVNQDGTIILKTLFTTIRSKLIKMKENFKSVCLIIGNINDILTAGVTVAQLFIFISYVHGLLSELDGMSLVISTHTSDDDEGERLLGAFLKNISDITVTVAGLQTGLSKDVSGSVRVSGDLVLPGFYHYRLLDRQIKMFSPGSSAV